MTPLTATDIEHIADVIAGQFPLCADQLREHARMMRSAPETKAGQDAEQIAWALAAYESGQTLINEGGGDALHVRQNRALGILFAEIERLEKLLYPIGSTEKTSPYQIWICPNCKSENRGDYHRISCPGCGKASPAPDVKGSLP